MNGKLYVPGIMCAALLIGGCTSANKQPALQEQTASNQILTQTQQSAEIVKQLQEENQRLATENQELSQTIKPDAKYSGHEALPPDAKPGECYAQVLTPPRYSIQNEQVLKTPASFRVEVVPPEYQWVEEKVLVREESEKSKVQPAQYEWQNVRVIVKEKSQKIITTPARYKTIKEEVLVRPAYSTWKTGKGPIQKIDHATGEIMCLVEVPAEYKTVEKQVLIEQASTKTIEIPAEYKIIKKRVLIEPEKVVKTTVPAQYRSLKVKKVVKPAAEKRIEIPAQYQTIQKREKVEDSVLEWRPILCETNTTPHIIRNIQEALLNADYNPGELDGILGKQTMSALTKYQKNKGLASGRITMETLKSLSITH